MNTNDIKIESTIPGQCIVRVEDVALPFITEVEAMVRDEEFAKWLGYARPRKVRELIKRLYPENGVVCERPTVGRSQTPTGGAREVVVNEFWLTREQALNVAARSETPRARAMLDLIVRVFIAVLDGKLVPASNDNAELADLRAMVMKLAANQSALVTQLTESHAATKRQLDAIASAPQGRAIGREVAREKILLPVRQWARAKHALDETRSYSGWCSYLHAKLRQHASFPAIRAHSWEMLPGHLLPIADLYLQEQLAEMRDVLVRQAKIRRVENKVKQLEMKLDEKPGDKN